MAELNIKKFLGQEGTKALIDSIKENYSPIDHVHETVTKAEEATHAESANTATNAEHANEADHATNADNATTADSATKAEQDGEGNVIVDTYALIDHTHSWNDLKDKPFGEIEDILFDGTLTPYDTDTYVYEYSGAFTVPLVDKQEYCIELNGEKTINIADEFNDNGHHCILGNRYYFDKSDNRGEGHYCFDNGYSQYFILYVDSSQYSIDENNSIHLKVYISESKDIDEQYIPDTIARKSDLQNIDLSGLETKEDAQDKYDRIWNAKADIEHTHSWNDLEDKPFYEIETEGGFGILLEETEVEIGEDLYASIPVSVELEVGKEYVVVFNGVTYNCVSWYSDDNSVVMLGNGSIYGGEGQGEDVPFSIDSHDASDSYLNTVNEGVYTISISGELPSLQIVTIDEKFIPSDIARFYDVETYVDEYMNDYDRRLNEHMEERLDTKADSYHEHNWRDISNKPFGYEISSQENIVPYQSITISDYTATIEGFTVLPDCPYTIIYNGTEYKVRSVPDDSINTYGKTYSRINILDYTLGYDNETSSLPFCIEGYDNENNATLYTTDIENGEITIEITRGYVIFDYKTIDEKFLPDSVVRVTDMPEQVTKTSQLINDSGFVTNNDLSVLETKSDAQAKLDEAKSYTDTAISNLVNSAPETLNTLGELATAFTENKGVVDALDAAITNKVDNSVYEEHVTNSDNRFTTIEGDVVSLQAAVDEFEEFTSAEIIAMFATE